MSLRMVTAFVSEQIVTQRDAEDLPEVLEFVKQVDLTRFDVTVVESDEPEYGELLGRNRQVVFSSKVSRPCTDLCKWRTPPEQLPLQRNALRVEIMPPASRCKFMMRFGRIGGRDDDYLPCIKLK